MSMVTNTVLDYIFTTHSHRILQRNQLFCNRHSFKYMLMQSRKREPALNNCFGFLDGTVRPICRPGEHQRVVYNGHKLKFQSIDLPNGLIANMYGPVGESICYSIILFLKGRTPLSVQKKKAVHRWDNWLENHIFAHHFL